MSIINYASREIQFKIVYYGPALCGKTTNLGYIHQRINPSNRGDLVSLATAADRTLFFDFLPVNAVVIKGFVTKFQLYTVPGQVIYNATRQLVLRSVDGVVFVADSQWEKMEENVESFKNLADNLSKQNISIDEIPYVLQYNKRDLPNIAPVNYLEFVLNNRKRRAQSFEVISSTGQNVFASLNAVSQILLHKFSKQSDSTKSDEVTGGGSGGTCRGAGGGAGMNAIPVFTIEDVATLDGILAEFLQKAEAELTVIIDRGGNVISQYGDMAVLDVTIIAALAAGSFAATKELARRIGELEFNALYHQGNGSHIFMNSVDDDTIMITVFGPRTTVGLVRFYSSSAAQKVGELLKSLQGNTHEVAFEPAEIGAGEIFTE